MKPVLSTLLAGVLASGFLLADEPLGVGSPAPALASGDYVQGERVKAFEKGKTYIVEFWATWCGPCVATIPHVNELQEKFADKGLVVIGQNVWERDDALVAPFVKKMGDKMTYRVALDDKSTNEKGSMAETWMEAAGQDGIPAAFVVDKEGTIAWIGHPGTLDEEILGNIIDGKFDVAAYKEKMKKQEEADGILQDAFGRLNTAMTDKDFDAASKIVEELQALKDERVDNIIPMIRFDICVQSKDGKAAGESALAILEIAKAKDEKEQAAMMLNQIAWSLATAEGVEGLDNQVAVTLAKEASAMTEGNNAAILDTLARAQFVAGDKEGAIATQENAVKFADEKELKTALSAALESYKKGELPPAEEQP